MTILRRFLVIQALTLWQGGFLFYAAVVVPIGTDELGSFSQGRVTRHVTDAMNVIGFLTVAILVWDTLCESSPRLRRTRWICLALELMGLAALMLLHPRIESYVDFSAEGGFHDYAAFYRWHRVYLYVATGQWLAGLGYVAVMLRGWSKASVEA